MPAGVHQITATNPQTGEPLEGVRVQVDRQTAALMSQTLREHQVASPQRPYFDFAHARQEAAAWPVEFAWRDGVDAGVYARVQWSDRGREAVAGRSYRSFSPSFFVDGERVTTAGLNMGGLVNDPAFRAMKPIWASHPTAQSRNSDLRSPISELPKLNSMDPETNPAGAAANSNPQLAAAGTPVAAAATASGASTPATTPGATPGAAAPAAPPATDGPASATEVAALRGEILTLRQQLATAPRQTPSGVQLVRPDQGDVFRGFINAATPLQAGRIYAADIRPRLAANEQLDLRAATRGMTPIDAANALGTLSGSLVLQRSLELLRYDLPLLSRISTDLSNDAIRFNQTVYVRKHTPPTVTSYNTSTGYSSSDITATDVPVVINAHKAVQVDVNVEDLASTNRALLDEQAEGMKYALALDLTDALFALLTAANFAAKTTEAEVDFDRTTVIDIGKELTKAKAPGYKRTLILNPDYYAKLAEDQTIVAVATNPDAARAITTGKLPDVHGFGLIESGNLPTLSQNLVGAGFCPSALALASRVPDDYTKVYPNAGAGARVQIITDADTGLSMMMVMFVDHTLARVFSRVAWMYGVAKGDTAQLRRLVSA